MFFICVIVLVVVLVCRVDIIKWLVNDVWIFICVVLRLWILLIIIMLGFWWRMVCKLCVKVIFILVFIWVWLIFGILYLIGFLIVRMLWLCELIWFIFVYKVVFLLEFVGLVIKIILCGLLIKLVNSFWLCLVIFKFLRFKCVLFLLSRCSMICLLKFDGIVDICILIVWLVICKLIWLFCGICFFVILSFVIILICDINNEVSLWLGFNIFFKMLLILKWIISFCLNVLIWIFEVFFLIVLFSIVLISLMIGVLLLLVKRFLVCGNLLVNENKLILLLIFFIICCVLELLCWYEVFSNSLNLLFGNCFNEKLWLVIWCILSSVFRFNLLW